MPSIFFGYKLVKQERFTQNANSYVSNISLYEGQYLLQNKIDANSNKITLIYGGTGLSEQQKEAIIQKSRDFDLENAEISIKQGLTFSNLDNTNIELLSLKEEIISLNSLLSKKNSEIDSILNHQKFGKLILNEIKAIYPQINSCIYSESSNYNDTVQSPQLTPIVILSFKSPLQDADKQKIRNWLIQRLKNNAVKVYYE